ncbi:guanylate kinase [Fusarium pseudocircinatum]|uniref:guanylate kinase n=1 Tax=Fusarium pseudocircinatum TaxID=56676 RepID=A0A8H5P2Y3_9HYPO|nr:guanylate kinase [Fusarium pseudocircinatum]
MNFSGSESLTYHMSTALLDTRPIIISGPSGVGKGTLIQRLKCIHPTIFSSAISHTTRQPRPGEVEGVAYFFCSAPEFHNMKMRQEFVEHTYFSGNFYGTSKKAMTKLMKEGLAPILDIEMEGIKKIQSSDLVARYVFIKPPSLETLEVRLRARGTENEASISQRLAQAKLELEFAETGVHDIIIVNDDLDEAYQRLEDFVFQR